MELSIELIALFFITGIAAGFVDSISGGGGLLTMPLLLWSGLSPAVALGTNKLQGTIGTLTASLNYYRKGHVPFRTAWLSMITAFIGSAIGAFIVQQFETQTLSALLPILLIGFSVFFMFSNRMTDEDARQRLNHYTFALTAGLGIGFYDGFFGPGTGAFFVIAFITLLGYGVTRATAHTKLLNFSSNISALIFFQLSGLVVWEIGLIMGLGQMIGSYSGSHMTMKHGVKLVKLMIIIVSILMSLKLLYDSF